VAARSIGVLIVAIGVLASSAMPAGAAPDAAGTDGRVTFGVEPASVGGAAVRPNFSFAVTPGAIVDDDVAVENYSPTPLALQVYATDALEATGGGFGLLAGTATPTGVGTWITLPPGSSTVQVPAKTPTGPGYVIVPFTVHVPVGATPGDHAGGIVASLQTVGTNRTGQRVVLDQRVGTRVFLRVSGTLAPQLTLTDLRASYAGTVDPVGRGMVAVSYVVHNTGNTDLAVDQSVTVSGPVADTRTAPVPRIALLLPGSSVAERVEVPGLWPQLLLHTSVTARPSAVPGSALPALAPVTATTWVWAIPWTLLVIVVIVLAAAAWWYRRRRRRRSAPAAVAPSADTPSAAAPQPAGASR
jgi:hypothetical protein